MKEKKARLKLEDIKVESFITALDENAVNKLIGATDDDGACGTPVTCVSNSPTCGATCYTCETCYTSGSQVVCCICNRT
jgi:hypothetical protein